MKAAVMHEVNNIVFEEVPAPSPNRGELLALLLAVSFAGKAPLLAVQIIWVNLVTDATAAIPLGLEPKSGDELRQRPRDPRVGLMYPGLVLRVVFLSVLMGIGTWLIFDWAQARMSLEEARTVAFCAMVTFQWFQALNARSDEHTIFQLGVFRNRWLMVAIGISILLQLAVVYIPVFQTAFRTVPIGIDRWGIVILAGVALFFIEVIRKMLFPRLFNLGKWRPVA